MAFNTDLPYLVEDSSAIARDRRIDEQAGTYAVTGARVNEKDHTADYQTTSKNQSVSGEYLEENGVESHPKFRKNQAYDGRDPELIVLTNLRPGEAAEIAEQLKLQNELRLGLQHGKKFDPKPSF
jgi:hypothetical protein